jgi:phospholipid/cholesterol/gamma-HCH transport system permease protein
MEWMTEPAGTVRTRLEGGVLTLVLSGSFALSQGLVDMKSAEELLDKGTKKIRYDASALAKWDGGLVASILALERAAGLRLASSDRSGLPPKLRSMLEMADSDKRPAKAIAHRSDAFAHLGRSVTDAWRDFLDFLDFSGLVAIAFCRFLRGKTNMRRRDFWDVLQSVSVEALGIVILISFLVGLIIAFLGAVVLRRFGAEFAIAYLVGYGILREMGAIMTGVIMAGRTGAAFAAQIGSMKVSEEIDALKTLGVSPTEFLVLPRVLALVLMMPVLTIFADLIGIFGGFLVAVSMMGVPSGQFFTGLDFITGPKDFWLGIIKSVVFGMVIAVAGCMRGMQSKTSADSVGVAATRAVVLGITLIIVCNAVIDFFAARFNI